MFLRPSVGNDSSQYGRVEGAVSGCRPAGPQNVGQRVSACLVCIPDTSQLFCYQGLLFQLQPLTPGLPPPTVPHYSLILGYKCLERGN